MDVSGGRKWIVTKSCVKRVFLVQDWRPSKNTVKVKAMVWKRNAADTVSTNLKLSLSGSQKTLCPRLVQVFAVYVILLLER